MVHVIKKGINDSDLSIDWDWGLKTLGPLCLPLPFWRMSNVLNSFFAVTNFLKFVPFIIGKQSSWQLWGYIFTVRDGIGKSYFLLERLQGMNVMAQSTSLAIL